MSKTQLGKIVFSKGVKVYQRGADTVPQFHLNAKKGSLWRVHLISSLTSILSGIFIIAAVGLADNIRGAEAHERKVNDYVRSTRR